MPNFLATGSAASVIDTAALHAHLDRYIADQFSNVQGVADVTWAAGQEHSVGDEIERGATGAVVDSMNQGHVSERPAVDQPGQPVGFIEITPGCLHDQGLKIIRPVFSEEFILEICRGFGIAPQHGSLFVGDRRRRGAAAVDGV